jgi:large subunit ribosomal protein L35
MVRIYKLLSKKGWFESFLKLQMLRLIKGGSKMMATTRAGFQRPVAAFMARAGHFPNQLPSSPVLRNFHILQRIGVQSHHQTQKAPQLFREMSATSKLKKYKLKKHGKSLKTRQAAAKRFMITGKGKLKRGHPGKRHNTGGKPQAQLNRLNNSVMLHGTQMAKNMHKLLINRTR